MVNSFLITAQGRETETIIKSKTILFLNGLAGKLLQGATRIRVN